MIEESRRIRYLDTESVEIIYDAFYQLSREQNEPVPDFTVNLIDKGKLENLIILPQTRYFGFETYQSLPEKASAFFYSFVKNHIFFNGNKRMAVLCTDIFLAINDKHLSVDREELVLKALEVVNSESVNHKQVKKDLSIWIEANLTDLQM
jgi:death-on-curing family protein